MRKLATAALAFSAAIFLANYILPGGCLTPLAAVSALLGAALVRLRRRWLRPAVIALLFFALGLLEFAAYQCLTIDRAKVFAGEKRAVSGVVLDYPEDCEGYCRLRVRTDAEGMPHFKAIVYDNDKRFLNVEPGRRISFTAKINTADTLFGKPYDNYVINGFFWKMTVKGDETVGDASFALWSLPVRIRHLLCERVDRLFPEESRIFIKALLLGDKQELYDDDALYVTLSRAGLMHVAAVSGLHIAFLVGMLLLLFGNGRRGALAGIALAWCFLLVSGSSKSAVRAAFMQTLLLLAPILRRENDPVTSLSAVLALILAACPFAARSVSLQLSFAAMAGILCFSHAIRSWLLRPLPKELRHGPLAYVPDVMASSLSVMVFTVPLTALYFSYVPLLAVFSNLLCLWAVSACFCTAWSACLLSSVPVLGTAAVRVCTALVRYILFCAGRIAAQPHAVLYMETKGALAWMLTSYALLAAGFLLRKRKVIRVLLPVCLSLGMLAGILLHTEKDYRENDRFSILDVGQGQCIAAMAGDDTVVIDCGNSSSLDDAGSVAGEYLLSRGRRSVQLLMLTHLHADHADGVVRLMEMINVEKLVLPAQDGDPGALYEGIVACAKRHGTEILELERDAELSAGRIGLRIYDAPASGKSAPHSLMARLSIGDADLLVTGDATKKQERGLVEREDLSGTEFVTVGHHGSKNAAAEELLREAGGSLALISVGWNNFGHPTEETLARLSDCGYAVRRTDLDGMIELILSLDRIQ